MLRAHNFRDLTGLRFAHLKILKFEDIAFVGVSRKRMSRWVCLCDCGALKIIKANHLLSGHTKSCGCKTSQMCSAAKLKHGQNSRRNGITSEYRSWYGMKTRCQNQKQRSYRDYGGRGIEICERWNSFENFILDMGPKPSPKHSIDRIDNNGNYEPENCRWATPREQRMNQRPRQRRD